MAGSSVARWIGPVWEASKGLRLSWKTSQEVGRLLVAGADAGASDIFLQTGMPVLGKIYDRFFAFTDLALGQHELERIAVEMTNASALATLQSGSPLRCALQYGGEKRDDDGDPVQYRFRANISAINHSGQLGIQIALRYINIVPPTIEQIALEDEIVQEATPARGLVLFSGPTGAGKTNTGSALIRHIQEGHTPIRGNLLLFEDPIEFVYSDIPSPCCTVAQHEVPTHIPSFEAAIADSLRRHPALLQIQELREVTTVSAAVEASNTGIPVHASVHANTAAHVLQRLTEKFPQNQQDAAFANILETQHMVVSQALVRRRDGTGMVCLREWQVLHHRVREELHAAGRIGCTRAFRKIIDQGEGGRSMKLAVDTHFKTGAIDAATAARVLQGFGYEAAAHEMRAIASLEGLRHAS